jgi:uncharacterized protein (DUF885 family)
MKTQLYRPIIIILILVGTASPGNAIPAGDPQTSIAQILASLEGLSLDEFFEASFKQWVMRSPERVTRWGFAAEYGMRNDRLDDLSDAYVRATNELEVGMLDLLYTYDRESLTPEQRISYDVYAWWLENQVAGHAFFYHDYILDHRYDSYHLHLDDLFSEDHPLSTKEDVQDYISRLNQVLHQTEQIMERLTIQQGMGIVPPDFIIQLTQDDIDAYLGLDGNDISTLAPESLVMYARLDESLDDIRALTDEERQDFRTEALAAVETSVIPAYALMLDSLERVKPLANDDAGVWKLPEGENYYAHMLRKRSTTDLIALEIHALGLAEVERCQTQLRAGLVDMGYATDAPLAELMSQAKEDTGYYDITTQQGQDEYINEIKRAMAEAEQRIAEVCDLAPTYPVVLIIGRHGGYYRRGTEDGTRPASFHESLGGQRKHKYSMYSYIYHETTPGHHFQLAAAQALDLPTFRRYLIFTGHVEGWAEYGEVLAEELGLYADNPGNLGRLHGELVTAAMLVADTGLHALGWTHEQARTYMEEALPFSGYADSINRYTVIPAQAVSYKIGSLMIIELRQRAKEQLGDRFDVKEFHNLIIGNGSLPLDVLEQVVREYYQLSGPSVTETWRARIRDFALIAHYALDETGGQVAYDSVGENHAALFGNPTWQPAGGIHNGALSFNGVNDFIGTEFLLDPSEDTFSVYAWIKGGAPGQAVVSQLWGTNWLMADATNGHLRTELRAPSHTAQPLVSDVIITDGDWHRVGLICDGRHRILQVDGVEVARDTHPDLARNVEGLNIGCGPDMTDGTFWSGMIDDVRVYSPAVIP